MSYNSVNTPNGRIASSSYGHPSSVDDVTAPGSPYLEFVNRSLSSEQDYSLPDRPIRSPVLENANALHADQPPAIPLRPKGYNINTLFKRGSKDTLSSNNASPPINYPHSPALARAQQPALQHGQTAYTSSNYNNNSIQNQGATNNGGSSSPSAPTGYQQQPTNNLNNSYNTNSYPPPSVPLASMGGLTRPSSPFAMVHPSGGSLDGRDNTNSISSTHRSSKNLSLGTDPAYNLTQTDLTLDNLAQRWSAYQAVMRKRYAEDPFYKRWTRSKWILLLTTILLLGYSCAIFGICLGYALHKFELAIIVMEFHSNLIYLALAGSTLAIVTAIVGLIGIFRENRIYLSIYALMLWPVFAIYVSVGYVSFRRAKNQLRAHLKDEWVKSYTRDQRLMVQNSLKCCGYQDSTWYGEYDSRCFPMTILPGCQHKYNLFEDKMLLTCWTVAFALVPFQLFVMISSLLCSNHVDGMLRSGRPGLKSFKEEKQN